jgi:hypothetical protein
VKILARHKKVFSAIQKTQVEAPGFSPVNP